MPPNTRYATVSVEKDSSGNGEIYADGLRVKLNIGAASGNHSPVCDLDQYIRPFWNSDTIYNETVLLYSGNGGAAMGKLLFMPVKIVSVQSFDLKTNYSKTADYSMNGRTITRRVNSKMSFRSASSFDRKDLAWYNLQSQWIVVTYTHKDKWAALELGAFIPSPSLSFRDQLYGKEAIAAV